MKACGFARILFLFVVVLLIQPNISMAFAQTIAPGTSTTVSVSTSGQDEQLSFSGTAGQLASVQYYSSLPQYRSRRNRNLGAFATVITIDTPENGSALASALLTPTIAGGTCSSNALCYPDRGDASTPALLWEVACGADTPFAACMAGTGHPLGPSGGSGPGGFNTSACSVDPNVICGAVASLDPSSPNIATRLPSTHIPNSQWFAIGSDWKDTSDNTKISELRSYFNNLLAAMSISNPPPTLSGVLVASNADHANDPNDALNNDVIVTTASQFSGISGTQTQWAEFGNLAHASMPAATTLPAALLGLSNDSITESDAVHACIESTLVNSSTSGCAGATTGIGSTKNSAIQGSETVQVQSRPQVQMETEANPQPFEETIEERKERLKHHITFAPERMFVEVPEGDVSLANPTEVTIRLAPGKLVYLDVLQRDQTGPIYQGHGPAKIIRDDGLTKTIEIIPVQLGLVDVEIGAVYSDNTVAKQVIHIHVVPSSKGLKEFWLNGRLKTMALVLEDREKDREARLEPGVVYESIKYPIFQLNSLEGIKLSVKQVDGEGDPVIRVDKNGVVHALREGKAYIVGDFDGVSDRILVTVYTKENAPSGYIHPQ